MFWLKFSISIALPVTLLTRWSRSSGKRNHLLDLELLRRLDDLGSWFVRSIPLLQRTTAYE